MEKISPIRILTWVYKKRVLEYDIPNRYFSTQSSSMT
jgi:hypothetical protein